MEKGNKVIIIGGEGTATNIAEAIIDANQNYDYPLTFIGFANDKINVTKINGHPIVCKINDLKTFISKDKDMKIIFALYKPMFIKKRSELLAELNIPFDRFINFIHPLSYISPSTQIGFGNVVLPNCNVLSNTKIENFNIFNCNCTIEHDTKIHSNNFIAAGTTIGASVIIKDFNFIGLNSTIKEDLIIPSNTFIGMGSNVLKSPINSNEIWYGNPAQRTQDSHQ